ncbi:MAG: transposase [Cyanobacteria bacterium P01_C01_bin.72]
MYLVIGQWRIPWIYRVYRGKGHLSPTDLGRRLLTTLPKILRKGFRVMVLADSAFGTIAFLKTVRRLKFHALVGIRKSRKLIDGRSVSQLYKGGQRIYLVGLPFPVTVERYYFKREDGKMVKRYILCTRQLKIATLIWLGKRRWKIEGWFKTIKHRFSLHKFGQGTFLRVHRWIVLCLISFVLALWGYSISGFDRIPDWGIATQAAMEIFFPSVVLDSLLKDIKRLRPIALQQGLDIQISRCKI